MKQSVIYLYLSLLILDNDLSLEDQLYNLMDKYNANQLNKDDNILGSKLFFIKNFFKTKCIEEK